MICPEQEKEWLEDLHFEFAGEFFKEFSFADVRALKEAVKMQIESQTEHGLGDTETTVEMKSFLRDIECCLWLKTTGLRAKYITQGVQLAKEQRTHEQSLAAQNQQKEQ